MYIPAAFRETDTVRLHQFIHEYGFAILTTTGSNGLVASHLPILLDSTRGTMGTLFGHFAKANHHANDFGCESLIVFSGPHVYVSPTWYETPNTVPTWNYVAVHAYGILSPVTDRVELNAILEAVVDKYESPRGNPWTFDPKSEFHQKLMDGIVGFRIEITRLEGKWKLNQNHPVERRERVIQALKLIDRDDAQEIAQLMVDDLTTANSI